jgi:hypothetical protein
MVYIWQYVVISFWLINITHRTPRRGYGSSKQFRIGAGSRRGRHRTEPKQKLVYEYDFGDVREHVVLLEKVFPAEAGVEYPRATAGKRACPPEDVGGIWGYTSFLEAISDVKHPEHTEMLEWGGGEFEPELFDLAAVNESLHAGR